MEIITRKEAIAAGKKFFFNGKVCPAGHISERYVSDWGCKICSIERSKIRVKNYPNHMAKIKKIWRKNNTAAYLIISARGRAKAKGIEFTITKEDIPNIGDYCPIFGIKYSFDNGINNKENSPSIDRIDPTKGYIPGNICIISHRANMIKGNATAEEHEAIARYIRQRTNN